MGSIAAIAIFCRFLFPNFYNKYNLLNRIMGRRFAGFSAALESSNMIQDIDIARTQRMHAVIALPTER